MNADEKEPSKTIIWSEKIFKEIICKEYFPSAVKDLSVQKDIITRFLAFYLGGRVQKGMHLDDLVFAVLSILPISPYTEEFVWTSALYRDDGKAFFLTPQDKLVSDVKKEINEGVGGQSSAEEIMEISDQNRAGDTENTLNTLDDIVNIELDNYDLDEIQESEEDEAERSSEHELRTNTNEITINAHDRNVSQDPVNEFESKPNITIKDFPKGIKFPFGFASKPIQKDNQMLCYGPVENSAFITCCNQLLSRWDTDSRSRAVLKSFFAVVAFVLMRATTKGYNHLFSTFHGDKFRRLLRHSILCGFQHYSPPHKRCLKRAYRTFSRRDGKTPTMFAKLLSLAISDIPNNRYLTYVVHNGLMNYTADYGFNLIRLLRIVCNDDVDSDVARVMKSTLCEETVESWKKVAAFLSEYCASLSTKGFLLSYRWARVLDGRFFKDVSCQQNYGLAVILTVFVEKITGDSAVWQSTWVENDELEKFRELGRKFYEGYESQGTREAQ